MADKRVQYSCEYPIKSSPHVLWEFLYNPNEMSEWYADKIDRIGDTYIFYWNGSKETAVLLDHKVEHYAKYKRDDMGDKEYFEFKIEKNDLTNNVLLTVTDFADSKDVEDQKLLWDSQIHALMHRIGS
jgi:hypothetical protein